MTSWWHDQAGRFPLLTAAEEITLGQQVQRWLNHPDPVPPAVRRRGQRARDRFIHCNLRLVLSCADRYRSVPPSLHDDMVQAGNIGLMRAVEKFDPARGYKFSTYAYWWIRQGINGFLQRDGRAIRLPTTHSAQYSRLATAAESLNVTLGRAPTRDEVASESGLTVETIERVLARPILTASLDSPNPRCDGALLGDALPAAGVDLLEQVATVDEHDRLLAAIAQLDPIAQRIITDQFLSPHPTSQQQLAKLENISRDQVRSVINRSLQRLRLILRGSPTPAPPQPKPLTFGAQIPLPLGLD